MRIKLPKTIPPPRERRTFFEYIARKIARREGIRESTESSIETPRTQ